MLSKSVAVLCVLGIVFSSYLLYLHYTPEELDSSFCNISNFLSCSTVNTSSYATFLGIPVALIGVLGFIWMLYLSFGRFVDAGVALFYSSLLALLFMLYLTFAELFIIGAVCIVCVSVLVLIMWIFWIAARRFGHESVLFVKELKIE